MLLSGINGTILKNIQQTDTTTHSQQSLKAIVQVEVEATASQPLTPLALLALASLYLTRAQGPRVN